MACKSARVLHLLVAFHLLRPCLAGLRAEFARALLLADDGAGDGCGCMRVRVVLTCCEALDHVGYLWYKVLDCDALPLLEALLERLLAVVSRCLLRKYGREFRRAWLPPACLLRQAKVLDLFYFFLPLRRIQRLDSPL